MTDVDLEEKIEIAISDDKTKSAKKYVQKPKPKLNLDNPELPLLWKWQQRSTKPPLFQNVQVKLKKEIWEELNLYVEFSFSKQPDGLKMSKEEIMTVITSNPVAQAIKELTAEDSNYLAWKTNRRSAV